MDSKALTQVPMGAIKHFIEENFTNINYSEAANQFFEKEFLGDIDKLDNLIALKDGSPKTVSEWLKNEYGINLDLNGDYAIATVLALFLEFERKAEYSEITGVDGALYAGGKHSSVGLVNVINRDSPIEMYKLNLKNNDFEVFVSEKEVDKNVLNKHELFATKTYRENKHVKLYFPLVKYNEKIDLSRYFKDSTMTRILDGKDYDIDEVKTITMLDLGLDKVEIKQVAAMTMTLSACGGYNPIIKKVIRDDFFIYIRYKGKLLFASKMLKEDFILDKDFEKEKECC